MLVFGLTVSAAVHTDSVSVGFRQSHIVIDRAFDHNGERLDSIFGLLDADSAAMRLRSVRVTGAASPEGSVRFNRYLSEQRAEAIFDQFRRRGLVSDSAVSFSYLGRDWRGLQREVRADGNVPRRAEVLGLLDRIVVGDVARPLAELKALGGGEPYRYMYRTIFPGLRRSQLVVEYDMLQRRTVQPYAGHNAPLAAETLPRPELLDVWPLQTPVCCKPFYMALKTNMLYDALLLPNVGAEVYVGRGWSVTADWLYGWWDVDRTHYYWRAYGGWGGVRRWFGRAVADKPLTGHHLGLFAGAVTYDFELGGKGIMGGLPHRTLWDRCNFIGGIEYGYSMPVARRLNIDFSVALGYIGGKYLEYVPKDNFYVWQSTHRLNWFGPVKAEVALVWLIGFGNVNHRKGGRI